MRIVVGVPGARTLKDRRGAVIGLRDRLRSRLKVGCHVVDSGEQPSRGVLMVTLAGAEAHVVDRALDAVDSLLRTEARCVVHEVERDVFAWGDDVEPSWLQSARSAWEEGDG